SLLLGHGDGTFASKVDFGVGSGPYCVAIRDLNGDGKPDLAVANHGTTTVSVLLQVGGSTGVPMPPSASGVVLLARPNPATNRAAIECVLPRGGEIALRVYDAAGRLVERLAHGWMEPGTHETEWSARTASGDRAKPGIYFIELQANRQR